MRTAYLFIPLAALIAAPAHAELPEPVRAMIDAAIATGDADKITAVVEVARTTNPDDTAEIDALLDAYLNAQAALAIAEERAEEMAIREAGLFDNWSGRGEIGAFQSSGNTDSVGLTAQVSLERTGIDWEHNFRFLADYRRTNGNTDREQYAAAYEPHFQVNDSLFVYGLAQFEADQFKGFDGRYAVSGGAGYRLVDSDGLRLEVKAGPAWRVTDFVTGPSESKIAALVGVDFDWQISDWLKLTQDTNAVAEAGGSAVAIIDSSNTTIKLVTGLEGKLSDRLTTRLSYTIDYDSNPPVGAVSTDSLSRFTLVYGF
jgi:putative salt-induced outer membrane protein